MAKGQQKQPGPTGAADSKDPKGKTKSSQPHVIQADLYQRANFTLQASAFLQHLQGDAGASSSSSSSIGADVQPHDGRDTNDIKARATRSRRLNLDKLSRNIMSANNKMVVHNQMKLDPSMKRNVCRDCSIVLIPGLTSRIRNRPSRHHQNVTNMSCLVCQAQQTIPCPPTSAGEPGLDGTKRAVRREKLARKAKIPFHDREARSTDVEKGHTLWREQAAIQHWGNTTAKASSATET